MKESVGTVLIDVNGKQIPFDVYSSFDTRTGKHTVTLESEFRNHVECLDCAKGIKDLIVLKG